MLEIIKKIYREIEDLYRIFFNLLEVLIKKRILDENDLSYIKNNKGEK